MVQEIEVHELPYLSCSLFYLFEWSISLEINVFLFVDFMMAVSIRQAD